jgi:hypothetical protein
MAALAYDLKTMALGDGEGSYLTRNQRHRGLQSMARDLRTLGFKLPAASSLKPRTSSRFSTTGIRPGFAPAL